MYQILRTLRAREDLKEIARYTLQEWGEEQMRRYLEELEHTIARLRDDPLMQGIARDEMRPGLRSLPHQDHYHVFYRVRGQAVEILRILHQRRNWQRFF